MDTPFVESVKETIDVVAKKGMKVWQKVLIGVGVAGGAGLLYWYTRPKGEVCEVTFESDTESGNTETAE